MLQFAVFTSEWDEQRKGSRVAPGGIGFPVIRDTRPENPEGRSTDPGLTRYADPADWKRIEENQGESFVR
eukprot:scaffold1800_cov332-Pavlova_lutheri.AAC.23